ncbi:MAG: hemerythrin domain-containing protein [Taibaiella sp.]|nr:hemerythrin domain-containing protein [Taibaiella sp.]
MTHNRYNVFNQIHKGLRHLMYDTAVRLQTTDLSRPEATEVINSVSLVVDLFDEHAHHEDKYVLPMVEKHNPALVADFEKDHELDHKLSDGLRQLVASWKSAATQQERNITGQGIFYAFNEFIAFNLYHMNREEDTLLATLWKHHTDEELHAASQAIVASIPPDVLMLESKWMMRSMNNAEIAEWMTGIKHGAPAEVYAVYLQMAEQELSAERFHMIASALETEITVAE